MEVQFNSEFYNKPQTGKLQMDGYTYEYKPTTKNRFWNLDNQRTTGIIIHSIGCPQPNPEVLVRNFDKQKVTASVHGFIAPGRYIETAPTRLKQNWAKCCLHVGGNWNYSRLGFEMVEPSTIRYTRGAKWEDLAPDKTKKFIMDTTMTAVQVIADMCIYHKIPVENISSHYEAHKLGRGSGHVDPEHLWHPIGYSLEQFRKDVQAAINAKKGDYLANMTKQEFEQILDEKLAAVKPKVYRFVEDLPDWGKPAVNKCIEKGFLTGAGKEAGKTIINLTEDLLRTIVINDRAGLYDAKK